ncbi:MAG: hypothetical protein V4557_11605 [Bacteroidota bacterium]
MRTNQPSFTTHRRGFLGAITKGAAAFGLTSLALPFNQLMASDESVVKEKITYAPADADQWFNQVKGKHKIVYDATQPHEIFPFAWPKVFLLTNQATGTPANDCGVVVVLRHTAIAYAFDGFGQNINSANYSRPPILKQNWHLYATHSGSLNLVISSFRELAKYRSALMNCRQMA